ncbi:MAG: glycoside hydrolase family 16 protein [Bacteroidales bacterium]|nr:glycoside hydrolase family 16 protein [Bacteroidales bacterium]MBK8881336.1 glycoside hydrolase family 16 protein [Bacteroidales bacterium]
MKILFIAAVILIAGLYAFTRNDRYHSSFFEDFNTSVSENFTPSTDGRGADFIWTFGADSPNEPGTKILSLKIDPEDRAGAGKGPEIISNDFTHFGTYAARLRVPDVRKIQPDVGAVVGYFTYQVDSVPGLSEIDFEWLLADPEIIYIGTWTGLRGDLKRVGRTINLASGTIYNTSYKERLSGIMNPLTGQQNQPETIPVIEGYDASARFYTYGFNWYPDRIRWWMIHPATADTVVLWDYSGSTVGIPQNHSRYRMNFWHTNSWPVETNPNSIEKPLHPYETEIDWMSYDPLKN